MKPTPRSTTYGPGSIKRRSRRTRDEIAAIKEAMYSILKAHAPMTVRGLFYQLTSLGLIPKTEKAYKSLVVRLATQMRLNGELPFEWIADNTRWRHGSTSYVNLDDWLDSTVQSYRLDLWRDQEAYVEVWCEKDALASLLIEETDPWCVPLMIARGFPSITYLANAAAHLGQVGKPCYVYYCGDYDPSGLSICSKIEEMLRRFAPEVDLAFSRIAVTTEQIERYKLPTRPTKQTDSRAKGFVGESVEVDAMDPKVLRDLVRNSICRHIDDDTLNAMQVEEAAGREAILEMKRRGFGGSR